MHTNAPRAQVKCCAMSDDGALVISGDRSGHAFLWQVQPPLGQPPAAQPQPQSPPPQQQRVQQQLAGGAFGEPVVQRHALAGGHPDGVGLKCCCFSADGCFAATGAADGSLAIWDVSGPLPFLVATSLPEPTPDPEEAAAAAESEAAGEPGCSSRSADAAAEPGQPRHEGAPQPSSPGRGAPQEQHSSTASGPLRLQALSSDPVFCCCLSPDGSVLAAGSKGGRVGVWSGPRRALQELPRRHEEGSKVRACAVSPDGRKLITGADDARAVLWDLPRGAALLAAAEHARPLRAAAFSADGARIATCGDDGVIAVLDIALLTCYTGWGGGAGGLGGAPSIRAGARLAAGPRDAGGAAPHGGSPRGGSPRGGSPRDAPRATGGGGGGAVRGGAHPMLRRIQVADHRLLGCSLVEPAHPPSSPRALGVLGPDARTVAQAGAGGELAALTQPVLCIDTVGQVRRGAAQRVCQAGFCTPLAGLLPLAKAVHRQPTHPACMHSE